MGSAGSNVKSRITFIAYSAVWIACGVLLPLLFHCFGLGKAFLPMHLPVIAGGMLMGWQYGLVIGMLTPLISSFLTGMPPLAPPVAPAMMVELSLAGALAGACYRPLGNHVYAALIITLISARLIWGLMGYFMLPLLGLKGIGILYPLTAGLLSSLPGIALQIILIPPLVYGLERTGVNKFSQNSA
ncbi:MAG: ECF transporter S component [Candidatus Eremiobacteraeota bacterium]|nr:ECF transporter S component [Candidatus Eremiobacteraeota bacterium]